MRDRKPAPHRAFDGDATRRRGQIVTAMRALVPVAALALSVAGCAGPDVTVALDTGSATVSVGDSLRVDIGRVNGSIGDDWFLIDGADTGVLTDAGNETEPDADCDGAGCGGRMRWNFEAAATGVTTLVFQYCFQSGPDDCVGGPNDEPAPDPVELEITVTD